MNEASGTAPAGAATNRGGSVLPPRVGHRHRRTRQAPDVIRGWIAPGRMTPVEPQRRLLHT